MSTPPPGPSHGHSHGHSHGQSHAHSPGHSHADSQGHSHGHAHGSHHGHHAHLRAPSADGASPRAFYLGIALNLVVVGAEVGFGLYAHSLSLIADASHNLGDVISLILAGAAFILARRSPSARFTYGLRGTTILAALANAMILLLVTGGVLLAAIDRLRQAQAVDAQVVVWVALCGALANGATALLFSGQRRHDMNARAVYLHMVADAAVSLGVVAAALAIRYTGWSWLDPLVSIAIAIVILVGTWELLKESLGLAVQAVPTTIDAHAVRAFLSGQEGVSEAHDLHIWAMSTTETALTAHLVIPAGHPGDAFLDRLAGELEARFGVAHTTLQIETGAPGRICRLAGEHVV